MKCIYLHNQVFPQKPIDPQTRSRWSFEIYKVAGLAGLFSTLWLVLLFSEEEKEAGQEEAEPLTGEEKERIAEMGKPMLGDHPKLEVIIEESYEFKVC